MSVPQLYFQPGGIAQKVLDRCTAIKQPFNPTVWAPNPHIQSALGLARSLTAKGSYTRQLILTTDHGTLGLDWWGGADRMSYAAPDVPIVLFIHGINGGSHEGYVKWACVAAASRGWRAVVLNMRGCNGLPLTSARGYNAINTSDVHVAVHSIRSRFPAAPLMAAGYSLGSVLLAKYLAEADNGLYTDHSKQQQQQPLQQQQQQSSSQGQPANVSSNFSSIGMSYSSAAAGLPDMNGSGLVAAALVSPPVCLHTTNSNLGKPSQPFKFMYNLAVAYKLREYVKEHLPSIQASGMNIDTDAMLQGWTVSSFDDAVTLRLLGYPAPHYYYRHACSTNWIPHIRTPTLIMLSKDDPFLGVLPQQQVQANPFTAIAATRKGGHLAFLHGWWPLGASYCDAAVDDWFAAALVEWRHGLDGILASIDNSSNSSDHNSNTTSTVSSGAFPYSTTSRSGKPGSQRASSSSSSSSKATLPELSPQTLPSWIERARNLGWQQQQVDPTTLSEILCKCSPGEDPFAQAHATDAVMNTAAAPATVAAAAAGKAAEGANKAASSVWHSWGLGFGSKSSSSSSHKSGLRGDGAWAPFEGLVSEGPSYTGFWPAAETKGFGGEGGVADSSTLAAAATTAAAVDERRQSGSFEGGIDRQTASGRNWRLRLRSRL